MGILKQHLEILCTELQKDSFISGKTLVISQQNVYITQDEANYIISKHRHVDPNGYLSHRHISKVKRKPYERFPNDCTAKQLFEMLGAESVLISDVSDYEKPDFLLDLNRPVPESDHCIFDTIIDFGTIEHVFDVSTALNNLATMLRPGGTLCLAAVSSNTVDHGFYSLSPTVFYDFFGANGFSDMRCYLREWCWYNPELRARLWEYKFVGDQFGITSKLSIETIFFARKVEASPAQMIKPIQTLYRRWDGWISSAQEEDSSKRSSDVAPVPLVRGGSGQVARMTKKFTHPSNSFRASMRSTLISVYVSLLQSDLTNNFFIRFGHLMPNALVSSFNRKRRSINNLRYLGRY